MNNYRRKEALRVRVSAAELANERVHPQHIANGDELRIPQYAASFTKGLPHDRETGLIVDPEDFKKFVKAIDSGDPRDFRDTPLGPGEGTGGWKSDKAKEVNKVRAWESQSAGNAFDLEGPDAQAVTMPPAPEVGSAELTVEIAEVYAQALLRDVPFTEIVEPAEPDPESEEGTGRESPQSAEQSDESAEPGFVDRIIGFLKRLPGLNINIRIKNIVIRGQGNVVVEGEGNAVVAGDINLGCKCKCTRRKRNKIDRKTAFRGVTPGDDVGPYISQFLLAGTAGITEKDQEPNRQPSDGLISYGAITIDQRVRVAKEGIDYMTKWCDWYDVQQGADLQNQEDYEQDKPPFRRFITTPRDLATYVHYDALYQAYLNACLILLAERVPFDEQVPFDKKIPFDPGLPFQDRDIRDHQQGFAHFGPPHILTLVTEVATRALKAVRFQKFNVHRRLRPEALAARLEKATVLEGRGIGQFAAMAQEPGLKDILDLIEEKNGNRLLPMAFCEGSPMHPSYGAGHATVAGACVTILKAFFDHSHLIEMAGEGMAFVPDNETNGATLKAVPSEPLTVEGELNKLASNISIGRNWAGVHYFSDYIESLRMGEQIAIGILEEQKLTYHENFSMTVPLFDGGSIRI